MADSGSDVAARSHIADPALAAVGERRIAWAARHAPVLDQLARERLGDGVLQDRRVAVVVHLEAKTAHLVTLLAAAGARVVAAGSNPASTQDAVCAALVARGIEVHGRHGASPEEFDADLLAVADTEPEIVVDDGAELTTRLLAHRPAAIAGVAGVTEQTTTGVARLRQLAASGQLPFPAVAANDARCKHLFDNRYGTGQSTLAAVCRLTNRSAAGMRMTVVGYGWVGKGLARYADGLGARVTVVDRDPVAALEAHFDGHRVSSLEDALAGAELVLAATGDVDAVPASSLDALPDGVLLANAGHDDLEIDIPALAATATAVEEVRDRVTRYTLPDGRRIHVLAGGALVNIAGADGHPVEIMDLSFSVQALAAHHLATHAASMSPGVHSFPAELDAEIARRKLETLGVRR